MINSELRNNGLDNSETGIRTFRKQTTITAKKVALTDVQNDNRKLIGNHQESLLFVEGRPIADMIKVCGTKRLTPECPSSHPFPPSMSKIPAKEHHMYAHKKFEYEREKGRNLNSTFTYFSSSDVRDYRNMLQEMPRKQTRMRENNAHSGPVVTPDHMAPKMTFSYAAPSLPSSLGKPGNGVQAAERDCLKVSSEVPPLTNSKRGNGQRWAERYIHLQNFLKRCDESDNKNLIQRLRQFSPSELSTYAVELEKKAIQLTIEEGKEMQRKKALNILGKPPTTMNPLQMNQSPQSKK